MPRWNQCATAIRLATVVLAVFLAPAITHSAGRAKLIERGWDMPLPQYVRDNIASMEQKAFDGVIINFEYGSPADNFSCNIFVSAPLNFDDPTLQAGISAIKSTAFTTMTHNFLDMYMSYWDNAFIVDWFDDWSTYVRNARLAVRVARQAGLKGVILDTEDYHEPGSMWQYTTLKYKSSKTFAQYQAQARQRGRQLMNAMIAEYPDLHVIITLGTGSVAFFKTTSWAKLANHGYGLVPAFIDGMLEAVKDKKNKGLPYPTLVDGFAPSYSYKNTP
jgi:hypothetical protein